MSELTTPSERQATEFKIKQVEGAFGVSSPHVELSSQEKPIGFMVTLEKRPTKVSDGTVVDYIMVDREGPVIQLMLEQARLLKNIPERERPRKIMELLRSKVHFAYHEVVEELNKTKPELAEWVAKNTGIGSSSATPLKLSEIVDAGYGVCRHLSVAMLVLANEAGLSGAYLTTGPHEEAKYTAHNVVRRDNGEQLFKLSKVGEPIGAHAWVELETSDGEWIPVDPSVQLVGDSEEGMATFREANYRAIPGFSLEVEGFPIDVGHMGNQELWFLPGEPRCTGILQVNSMRQLKPITLDNTESQLEDKEQWPKPTKYKGTLSFRISSHEADGPGMTVAVVDVKRDKE